MADHNFFSGVFITALAGVAVTSEMVFSIVMKQLQWPYWRITGTACVLSSLFVFVCNFLAGGSAPAKEELKWLALQTFFGCVYWCASIMAVQVGTNPGDVASLTSVNIVVAAVLGRLILQEDFRCYHVFAIVLAVGGALLITQPPFIFGMGSSGSWLGYAFAIGSGFLQGCFFISSRMAEGISGWFMSASILLASGPFCFAAPMLPGFSEPNLSMIAVEPLKATGFVAAAMATSLFSASTVCVGSSMCQAAVSATVYTSSSMICGYVVSAVLFGTPPSLMSLGGAALMLLSVVIVAFSGQMSKKVVSETTGSGLPETDCATSQEGAADGTEETDSFGSFVAFEFSQFSASSQRAIRYRRPLQQVASAFRSDAASVIGKAFPVVAVAPSGLS